MTERAIQLLNLDSPSLLLDIGCGSGLSGQVLEDHGHLWCGLDVSESMLQVALERGEGGGDLVLSDIGQGMGFRAGSFDGAISISVIQWLCNADKSDHVPRKRLMVRVFLIVAILFDALF
jgi:18S rRNA (guanine1575-N7)-methyltransferase